MIADFSVYQEARCSLSGRQVPARRRRAQRKAAGRERKAGGLWQWGSQRAHHRLRAGVDRPEPPHLSQHACGIALQSRV